MSDTVSMFDVLALQEAIRLLVPMRTFVLHKVAPTTFENDLERGRADRSAMPSGAMIRAGMVFRCRVNKGPFFYATSPDEAVRQAIANDKEKANVAGIKDGGERGTDRSGSGGTEGSPGGGPEDRRVDDARSEDTGRTAPGSTGPVPTPGACQP